MSCREKLKTVPSALAVNQHAGGEAVMQVVDIIPYKEHGLGNQTDLALNFTLPLTGCIISELSNSIVIYRRGDNAFNRALRTLLRSYPEEGWGLRTGAGASVIPALHSLSVGDGLVHKNLRPH